MSKLEEIYKMLSFVDKSKEKLIELNSRPKEINYHTLAFILLGNFIAFIALPFFGVSVSFLGTIVGGFSIGIAVSFFIGSIFKDFEENRLFGNTMSKIRQSDICLFLDLEHGLSRDEVNTIAAKSDLGLFKERAKFDVYYKNMIKILNAYTNALVLEKQKEELLESKEAQDTTSLERKDLKVLNMPFE